MRPAGARAPVPFFAILALILSAAVAGGPAAALAAARRGINLWWTAVLPGLLPFFILSDLLQNLGVVRALGVLLEPVMRPLFNLPGAAGFALALGFTSGQPGGVRAATRLVADGLCTPEEGARLAGFANAAGPLFVTGVTAVSLFRAPEAAPHLVIAHYGAALLTGMLLGHLPPAGRPATRPAPPHRRGRAGALAQAWKALEDAAQAAPPAGNLLGNAVRQGVELILLVGGFIVLFSVVLGVVEAHALDRWLAGPLAWAFRRVGLPGELAGAAVAGFLEVTAGVSRAAAASGPLAARMTVAAAILAWSGLSIHAQAAALLATAKLSYPRFLQGRLIQLVLSPLLYLAASTLSPGPAHPALALPPAPAGGPLQIFACTAAAFGLCLA
ncbi:MAG: nucleoside recognition domain-containing protein, partial [Chitinophagales bacterium]